MSQSVTRYPSTLPFPFSKAIRAGNLLLLSGQMSMSAEGEVIHGSITEQTNVIMERIGETLRECGADYKDVIKATIWLTSMDHFAEFNEAYKAYFQDALPVRSTVTAGLALGLDVEVEVQAWIED